MKTVSFALTQPAAPMVGDAVALDFQNGVVGPATLIISGGGGVFTYRVVFAAPFANARYVGVGSTAGTFVRQDDYVDVTVSTAPGNQLDFVFIGD